MSKNTRIVYTELSRRNFAVSQETLSRVCGMNLTVIGQCLGALKRRDLITAKWHENRYVYRSRQLTLWGAA